MSPAILVGDRVKVLPSRHARKGEVGTVVILERVAGEALCTVKFASGESIIPSSALRRVQVMA